ncbi:MAG: YdeI/OmpD-associated family protein [Bacteroidetes bacterium]|nr:YdeI/OmpD-associated family protein [Bacteroidota bacterium]MBU1679580.1 YdeI/OmpD-associated family protein [Bacteroidota bacterium]MBU2508094.1 YdeI/OmpD-associated family protein [Bacteroidota bacterium]
MAKHQEFVSIIYQIGINRCVDVPQRISSQLSDDRFINVTAEVDGFSFEAKLQPNKNGGHRLFLNTKIRVEIKRDTGDSVTVRLAKNDDISQITIPADLKSSLESVGLSLSNFQKLTYSQQKEIVNYIEAAKTIETRQKRISQVQTILEQKLSASK